MGRFGVGHWAPAVSDKSGEAIGQVADLLGRGGEGRMDGAILKVRLGLLIQRRKRQRWEVRVALVHLGHRLDHLGHHQVVVVVVVVMIEVVQVLGGPACRRHQAQWHADARPASLLKRVLPMLHLHLPRGSRCNCNCTTDTDSRARKRAPRLGCSRSLTDWQRE